MATEPQSEVRPDESATTYRGPDHPPLRREPPMSVLVRTTAVAGLALGVGLVAAPAASAGTRHHERDVVFVQNDALTGNAVVAFDRGADGALHQAGVYATGGLGGALTGAVVDHTASQGALTADR